MDLKFRKVFKSACQLADFSVIQTRELDRKIVENALRFTIAKIYEKLSQRMNEEEVEKLKAQFEDEFKVKDASFSSDKIIEFVIYVFSNYLKPQEVEEISKNTFNEEYMQITRLILERLDKKNPKTQRLLNEL